MKAGVVSLGNACELRNNGGDIKTAPAGNRGLTFPLVLADRTAMATIVPPTHDVQTEAREHPAKLVQGDDEDYTDYLYRQGEAWTDNPPPAPDGFSLIECDATPRHWPTYTPTDHDYYPAPCGYCTYDAVAESHRGCAHSHHRAWRRWRITHRVARELYASGITSTGGCVQWGGGCDRCQTMPRWTRTRRVYVLWVKTDTWRCLLKMHHLPGDPIGFGMCSKCLPCPDCGSKTAGHQPDCEAV